MNQEFLDEIVEQPDALRRCIDRFPGTDKDLHALQHALTDGGYDRVVLTGMGSSYYGFYPLLLTLNARLDLPVFLWDASELIHYAADIITENTLLIAMSQSGESAETVRVTQLSQQPKMRVSVTNLADNSLSNWADIALHTHAGTEATVSTKTYTTSLAVLHLMSRALTGHDIEAAKTELYQLAADMSDLLAKRDTVMKALGDQLGNSHTLTLVGRGHSLTSAQVGALITTESTKVMCLGLSSGQFRHGPLELAREGFNALVFAGDDHTAALNRRLAADIKDYGGNVLVIAPGDAADSSGDVPTLNIPKAPPELLPILEIVPVQLLTFPLAEAHGVDVAVFDHSQKITRSE